MSGPSRPRIRFTPTVGAALVFGALGLLTVLAIVLATLALISGETAKATGPRSTIRTTNSTDAVFIGDSYTQGAGASGPATRWVTLVSLKEGWEPQNLGRSGTGYLSSGTPTECGQVRCLNFVEMVPLAIAAKPEVVFVSGGQSDFELFLKDRASVLTAIDTTFASLRTGLPDAHIYAIGPSTTGAVSKPIVEFDSAVRAAAARAGATYVSLIEPNVIKPTFIAADRAHVNDAGYSAIAARIEEAIKK
ncbi:SGNH/GDSL hydrolase family protein [Frigoribacterium sp. UYMn621]|uniref:SGNH/GDSL hydrolase family protein n=1 Tax=Frigoribacterium sp. UYMn621 TaxID=3156343 RepID=UPI003398B1CB